jgi:hypothetical protein
MSDDNEAKNQNPEQTTTDIDEKNQSPIVKDIKWGCVDVENFGKFKDAKLYPGGE